MEMLVTGNDFTASGMMTLYREFIGFWSVQLPLSMADLSPRSLEKYCRISSFIGTGLTYMTSTLSPKGHVFNDGLVMGT